MKRILIPLFISMLYILSCGGIADLSDKVNEKGTPAGNDTQLYKIVVGDYRAGGFIYVSEDSGETWSQKPYSNGWVVLHSNADGSKLVAAPMNIGLVFNSFDGGNTWMSQSIGSPDANWSAITSSSDGSIFYLASSVAGSYIYRSTDSGVSWSTIPMISPDFPVGQSAWGGFVSSSDGNRLEVVVSGSFNFYTWTFNFDGLNWFSTSHLTQSSLQYNAIASSSDGQRLIIAGNNDFIYTSTDGGSSWIRQSILGSGYWRCVTSSSDGMRLTAAENNDYSGLGGYIWRSSDGGMTWVKCIDAGQRIWRKVAASPDGMFLAAGVQVGVSPGYIYTSNDGGVTWYEHTELYVVGNAISVTAK